MGLAMADGPLAEPLGIISAQNWESEIRRIIEEQKIEKIVLGLSEGEMGEKQKAFAKKLGETLGLPVELQEEILTTHDALSKMKEAGIHRPADQGNEDAIAAALILQAYLDKNV